MPRITINTKFGTVAFEFQSDEDLDEALSAIKEQIAKVSGQTAEIVPKEKRSPKPGLELAYGFTPDGIVELYQYPSSAVATIVLALYAYHPEMIPPETVEHATGIANPVSKVLGQTKNKKYFRIGNGVYGLSQEGLEYFKSKIEPGFLKPQSVEDQEASS